MTAETGEHRVAALKASLAFLQLPPRAPELQLLHRWLDSWTGVGVTGAGLHRQGWDLQLTQYGDGNWRATFYVTGCRAPRLLLQDEAEGGAAGVPRGVEHVSPQSVSALGHPGRVPRDRYRAAGTADVRHADLLPVGAEGEHVRRTGRAFRPHDHPDGAACGGACAGLGYERFHRANESGDARQLIGKRIATLPSFAAVLHLDEELPVGVLRPLPESRVDLVAADATAGRDAKA